MNELGVRILRKTILSPYVSEVRTIVTFTYELTWRRHQSSLYFIAAPLAACENMQNAIVSNSVRPSVCRWCW